VLGLPQYDAATTELIDMGSRLDPFLNPIPNLKNDDDIGMIIGACLWLPKSLWQELGGFPDWFGSLAEDMYLSLQARLYGFPVKALSHSGFRHWVGQSLGGGKVVNRQLSTKLSRRVVSERNKSYVMVLLYPAPFLQLLLPLHLCLLLLEGVLLSVLKRRPDILTDVYWNCPKALWKNRILLREKRRDLQARRLIGRLAFFNVFQAFPHKLRMLMKHGLPHIR
jgi:GT2 family glycosyltransferase